MSAHTIVSATCHNGVLTTRYANDDFDVSIVDKLDVPECQSCGSPLYTDAHHLCGSCQDIYAEQERGLFEG